MGYVGQYLGYRLLGGRDKESGSRGLGDGGCGKWAWVGRLKIFVRNGWGT